VFCFRVSPKTVLTYCTDGVLLWTLMGGDSTLTTVTHILVDEVHEQNCFSDSLLIALRDSLAKFRSLHLILMSATVNCLVIVGNVYVLFIVLYCVLEIITEWYWTHPESSYSKQYNNYSKNKQTCKCDIITYIYRTTQDTD
jgi:hypothetical protein